MIETIDNLIGLSKTECACFADVPEEAKESETGIYIDEVKGFSLKTLKASSDECNELWQTLGEAKEQAIKEFTTDLFMGLTSKVSVRHQPYSGLIGNTDYTTWGIANASIINSFPLKTRNIPNTTMLLKRIGLLINDARTVTVDLWDTGYKNGYKANNEVFVRSFEVVVTSGNKYLTLTEPYSIPLDGGEYEFRYIQNGFNYKVNNVSCGCSHKDRDLLNFIRLNNTDPAYGLSLDVVISCNRNELVLKAIENDETVKSVTGYALQFKAGEIAINRILKTDNINRFTLLSEKKLTELLGYYIEQYEKRINWLAANIQPAKDSCFVCGGTTGFKMTKGTILI